MSLGTKIQGLREIWMFENRLWLVATRIFFRKEKLQIYRYKGFDILIDHSAGDANGAREVLTSPMYSRFLPKMKLTGPMNVLDFGASNGGFPLLLVTNGVNLKKVVSVELNPRTYTRLLFNLTQNLDCKIVALNAALCGENGPIMVSLGKGNVSDNIYAACSDEQTKDYKISGSTLDSFCDEHFMGEVIDICKIDVEGAEFEVFSHPSHGKLAQCRYLIMEIHESSHRQAAEIIPMIEKCGLVRQTVNSGADMSVHFFINSRFA